jgi:hypothetical protein
LIPRDAVKKDMSTKEKLQNFLGLSRSSKNFGNENKIHVQMGWWPHTICGKHTCNPQWQDKIHFKVRTHDDSRKPIDLTETLLHVFSL